VYFLPVAGCILVMIFLFR